MKKTLAAGVAALVIGATGAFAQMAPFGFFAASYCQIWCLRFFGHAAT
jgi:hypothetical protein